MTKQWVYTGLALATVAVQSIACSNMKPTSEDMLPRAEVELDIFSGMPNPAWVLTDAETERFIARLSALQRTAPSQRSGHLGYRGFIVVVTEGRRAQTIRLQAGTVEIASGTQTSFAVDASRALERWLLDTGRPHLSEEVFQVVASELGPTGE